MAGIAKIYVGEVLVGVIDQDTQMRTTAQGLANAWPSERTVLVYGKEKEVITPGKRQHQPTPIRKPALVRKPA